MAISIMHCHKLKKETPIYSEQEGKFLCHSSHIPLKFSFINGCEWEIKIELFNGNKVAALIMEEI